MSMQRLPNIPGVSAAATGATALSMKLVVVPPGGAALPHAHQGFETAIYCLSGRVETRYGPQEWTRFWEAYQAASLSEVG
jgi:uncharacterized RmlC-like cupin family protein